MKRARFPTCLKVTAALFAAALSLAQTKSGAQPQPVPVMDGGAGPCSLELSITGADGKPVYAAKVDVHIAYGFGGFHRLDLEAGTNSDGKVKFTGLPAKVHRPPLEFNATKDDLAGVATYDPSTECQGKHEINMSKRKPDAQ
jgi:hypothetical protein